MTEHRQNGDAEHPGTEQANSHTGEQPNNRLIGRLSNVRNAVLTAVVALPPTLNAQNIVEWANSPDGLGRNLFWSWVVFGGLDAIAAVCVFETLIQTQKGRKAGAFALLVWMFALASAYAGYRHGTQPGVGRDVKWFFPFMALSGPLLLHLVLKRLRLDAEVAADRRLTYATAGAYGWSRWVPCVGAFIETYCAWRVGRLQGIVQPARAIARYRALRPDAGRFGVRVLRALRVEAERTLAANSRTPAAAPNATVPQATDRTAESEQDATVRPITSARRRPNNDRRTVAPPNGDVATNMATLRTLFGERPETPTVSEIADAIGVARSTAKAYRDRLIDEQTEQDTDTEEQTG